MRIRLTSERGLPQYPDLDSLLSTETAEGQWCAYPSGSRPAAFYPNIHFKDSGESIYEADLSLFKATDALVAPGFGAVISRTGDVFEHTFAEANFLYADISKLPGARGSAAAAFIDWPNEVFEKCVVSMPWGGLYNYGHFVLDCLPTVAVCQKMGSLSGHEYLFPPLKEWHRQHLRLLGLSKWKECELDLYRAKEVIWSNTIDHFLHKPNSALTLVPELQRGHLGTDLNSSPTGLKIWLSRKGNDKRLFERESELEARLARRGYKVLSPETLSVPEQIELFGRADVVSGMTGAAFANILYCRPSAFVVEVQPTLMGGMWCRNVAAQTGCRWASYTCPSRSPERIPIVGGKERPSIGIAIDLDIDDFEGFLAGHDLI